MCLLLRSSLGCFVVAGVFPQLAPASPHHSAALLPRRAGDVGLIRADSMHNSAGFGEGGMGWRGAAAIPSLRGADSIPSPGVSPIARRPSLRVRDAHAAPGEGPGSILSLFHGQTEAIPAF